MSEVLSNADVAQRLGIAVNSLNKRRTRMTSAGALAEGQHWFKDGDAVLWTVAGVAALEGDSAALVPTEGQTLSFGGDMPLSLDEDMPTPSAVAAVHAPAVVSRYLSAVDAAMASEVTRLLREGNSLGKHLASRWGLTTGGAS